LESRRLADSPAGFGGATSWLMRPLHTLIQRLDALESRLRKQPRPFHLVIVGGGASGCELALAIRKRLHGVSDLRMTLLHSHSQLMPQFPEKAGRIFADRFAQEGIDYRLNATVTGGD